MSRGGRGAIAAWLVLLAACGFWMAQRLVLTTDMSAFLPPAATAAQEILIGQMRSGVASRLLLVAIEDAGESELTQASGRLAEKLVRSGQFETVANGDAASAAKDIERLFALRYALSPGVSAEQFTAEGLRSGLQESLALLASSLSAQFRGWLAQDPTGEIRRLARLFDKPGGAAVRQGVWFSPDGKRVLLIAETRAPGFDLDAQVNLAHLSLRVLRQTEVGAIQIT